MSAFKILALTTLFLATTFAQTEWKEFTSPDFRVLFPDNPQQQTVTERNLHEFSATAGAESYGLAYADYSPGTDWETAVNSERDAIVNGLGGSVVDEKRTSVEGYPGKWIRFVGYRTRTGSSRSTSWAPLVLAARVCSEECVSAGKLLHVSKLVSTPI
jgi:hypothetical protein